MNEDYKICPYCNNAVDKKDKQCPYCLESLIRREPSNINKDDLKENKNYNNLAKDNPWKTSLLDILIENKKYIWWWNKKEIENKIINKTRNIFIISIIIIIILPFIIDIITSIFWE